MLVIEIGVKDERMGSRTTTGDDASGCHTEKIKDPTIPAGVAARQVIIDGDKVDAFARQRVKVRRKRGGEGLSFTSTHLGNFAEMECDAAQNLHVIMTL